MDCPQQWEFRVRDANHIVIEHNFSPILQLKWTTEQDSHQFDRNLRQIKKNAAKVRPLQLSQELEQRFQLYPLPSDNTAIKETALVCKKCRTTIHLQLLPAASDVSEECRRVMTSLNCHRDDGKTLWTLQETSFDVPSELNLQKSYFKAGLCWINLRLRHTEVQLVRLSPAKERLASQQAAEILRDLCGEQGLTFTSNRAHTDVVASRTPAIWQQLRFRMKRQPPFVEAALRHLPQSNVLAGCIITAREPIAPLTAQKLLPTA